MVGDLKENFNLEDHEEGKDKDKDKESKDGQTEDQGQKGKIHSKYKFQLNDSCRILLAPLEILVKSSEHINFKYFDKHLKIFLIC